MRLKQYPDDPNKTLIHVTFVNKKLCDTYQAEKGVSIKEKIRLWAQEDFQLSLECAEDLARLREAIISRYSKIFQLSEDKVKSAAWERYWIHLHIEKELNQI